jgi:hypothetical protein
MAAAVLLSRCHARRAAVAQTSPACAYCRRRPRRPHPRRLQESHQFGQESRAALLLSLACGTHCSVRGCNLVTPRLSAAARATIRQLDEVHRYAPRLVARQPIWSPSDATQQYVRNRGRSGSARLALETTLMTPCAAGCQAPRAKPRGPPKDHITFRPERSANEPSSSTVA